jgi:hypothetical protein
MDTVESTGFTVVASPEVLAVARIAQGLVLGSSTVLTNTSDALLAVGTSEVGITGASTRAGVHETINAALIRVADLAVSARPKGITGTVGTVGRS